VLDCAISDLISDHFAVRAFIKAHRPSRPRKKVTYRELNRIDEDRFLSDMLSLPLFTSPASDVSDLLAQYNEGQSSLLDVHAPVKTKLVTVRPADPWLTDEVLAVRKKVRA